MPTNATSNLAYNWLNSTVPLRVEREDMSDVGVRLTASNVRNVVDAYNCVLLYVALCFGRFEFVLCLEELKTRASEKSLWVRNLHQ